MIARGVTGVCCRLRVYFKAVTLALDARDDAAVGPTAGAAVREQLGCKVEHHVHGSHGGPLVTTVRRVAERGPSGRSRLSELLAGLKRHILFWAAWATLRVCALALHRAPRARDEAAGGTLLQPASYLFWARKHPWHCRRTELTCCRHRDCAASVRGARGLAGL